MRAYIFAKHPPVVENGAITKQISCSHCFSLGCGHRTNRAAADSRSRSNRDADADRADAMRCEAMQNEAERSEASEQKREQRQSASAARLGSARLAQNTFPQRAAGRKAACRFSNFSKRYIKSPRATVFRRITICFCKIAQRGTLIDRPVGAARRSAVLAALIFGSLPPH